MFRLIQTGSIFGKLQRRVMVHDNIMMTSISATSKLTYRPKTMMSMEDKLLSLPVPPLDQTLHKYITALEPLISASEYENTKSIVAQFKRPGGIGKELQNKLIEKAKHTDSWLAEWWDNAAYFDYRAPVVINSSPGVKFPDQTFFSDIDQYRYTAKLIHTILNFKGLVDSESLPVDYAGKDPLAMRQYKKLLSVCRVPHPKRDAEVITQPEESRHVIVVHNNHFYKLDVYKDDSTAPISEEEFVQHLVSIVNTSRYEDDYPVGVLTSQDRNVWAQGWKRLSRDTKNKANIDTIIKSICLICLDQPINVSENQTGYKYENLKCSAALNQMLHGGGANQNSMNRWFDKICQFIVNRNGMVGICYEHSSAEGPPVMALCNQIMAIDFVPGESSSINVNNNLASPERLTWNINYDLVDRIELAKNNISMMANDLDLRLFQFNEFGKHIPKTFKLSPDAFFQVSLQLAYFRLHGCHPPTYESGSIRRFAKGRTETIRSATPAAARFVTEMDQDNIDDITKKDLFLKAIKAHVQYTIEAGQFQAIDRHLLGLKLVALENGISLPEIFRDKAYGYAMHFQLSTSQVPTKFEACLAFGPVVPDGYGVCYNPMENQILYAVSSYNSHPKTQAGEFGEYIAKALTDIHVLLVSTNSKL